MFASATEIARRVREREVSPVAVVDEALARIAERNPELNAVVTLNPRALDEGREIEWRIADRQDVGPLAGVPVGIKDVTPVAGLRTHA